MKRLVIITVGKTHSGKTTFAKSLEQQLNNSLIIDQDNHAEFINTCYKNLLPKQGPNTLKYAVTQTIIDYSVSHSNSHIIICNSNRTREGRLNLLSHFHKREFVSIIVNFDIPYPVLQERVAKSERSTTIFRSASTYKEVLTRQHLESHKNGVVSPIEGEADYLFVIKNNDDSQSVILKIIKIAQSQ
ncbi:AAA family ATPase [Bacillus sp. NEB1478]|uniref:AAA family ATPase n=1 Tax=Bacillus sp. NEB1478 TaxID=3073816 RepID=UPI002873C298|nr:AAA family ATPase [Bacillus sp. NEB1478]WNB93809.1 AAA family ATPase [Bacillus sp. NEB1478]